MNMCSNNSYSEIHSIISPTYFINFKYVKLWYLLKQIKLQSLQKWQEHVHKNSPLGNNI